MVLQSSIFKLAIEKIVKSHQFIKTYCDRKRCKGKPIIVNSNVLTYQ